MAQVAASHASTMPPLGAQPGPQSPYVPSHDLDAEMSVLSAMLLSPTAIAAVSGGSSGFTARAAVPAGVQQETLLTPAARAWMGKSARGIRIAPNRHRH